MDLMKFKEKFQVLHLGRNYPKHQYMLDAEQLESTFVEKNLGVLVDIRLNVSQGRVIVINVANSWATLGSILPANQEK